MTFSFANRLLMAGLAFSALISVPGLAHADNIQFLNSSGSTGVTVHYYAGATLGFRNESTTAGLYNIKVNNGTTIGAYCTDLIDNIHDGETWTATRTTVQDPTNGLGTITYPGGTNNVAAIDYIAQHYIAPPSQPAAQLAIWDLVEGSHVSFDGTNYSFGTNFSETGYSDLASIYTIEQQALHAQAVGYVSNAILERPDGTPYYTSGRPQDLVYYNPNGNNLPIPEPAFYQMGVFLAGGGLMALRLRRKNRK